MDEIRKMRDDEIKTELMGIYLQEPTAEGYSAATDRLEKLYKLRIEEIKADGEIEFKKAQLAEGKKDRWIKLIVDGVAIGAPLVCYGVWYYSGLEFEKTGSIRSLPVRNLLSLFKPRR